MIRLLDIVLAIVGLILLLPLCLIISLILLLNPGGQVLFHQKRVGKDGKEFTIYKFRTMISNQNNGSLLTTSGDPRKTRFGSFLRKWKMDEVPQLINVLKGEMSIVGPRPEVPDFVKLYSKEQRRILKVKPGITDFASIEFLDEETMLENSEDPQKLYIEYIIPKKIELNLKYINNRSVREYFKIILLTIKKILK